MATAAGPAEVSPSTRRTRSASLLDERELAVGNGTRAVRGGARELARTYGRWCAEAEAGAADETIPIRHLVAIQYGAILAGADRAVHGHR
ncbi:hypothetical protein GCM10009733_091790 [Nonomuraea maheshkhaliensis]|uniref:Uncharacterized protein n=1 Tax=Nonomuraea maheshkhaliensis TaxID=419590 RepID=A0ABN2H3K2_9ACTN